MSIMRSEGQATYEAFLLAVFSALLAMKHFFPGHVSTTVGYIWIISAFLWLAVAVMRKRHD